MKYLCRATDEKEWTPVEALWPDSAAEEYAERLDDDSGGEWLGPEDDGAIILVKISEAAEPVAFEIEADYVKRFLVYEPLCSRCGGKGMPAHSCTVVDCPSPKLASAHGSQPSAASSRVAPSDANSGQQSEAGAAVARRMLTKIAEHAKDGQGGSASYAHDRLCQIRKVAELGLKRL